MNTNKIIKKRKDKSVKFLLAPRPQRDPLAADYEAPQHVLIPKDGTAIEEIEAKLPDFDRQLFTSKEETKTGMLERAHKTDGLLFDPDLMQAMSKEFDFEDPNNILNDDFMDQAGGLIEEDGYIADVNDIEDADIMDMFEDEDDENGHDGEKYHDMENMEEDDDDDHEETKSVFTNYSMTSSVMRRNQGLKEIDEHFERLFEREYADDTAIGPLDLDEVKGEELLTNIDQIRQLKKEVKIKRKKDHDDNYQQEIVSDHHKNAIVGDDSAEENDDLVEIEIRQRENRVDCESILALSSTLYNHPKLICEPRKRSTSSQFDLESVPAKSVTSTLASALSKLSVRPENETPEERKARKKALKEYRHARRQERKQNQQIFKSEHAKLAREQKSNQPALKLA